MIQTTRKISASTEDAVTLDELRVMLRVDSDYPLDDLRQIRLAAVRTIEEMTGRSLLPAVFESRFSAFPAAGLPIQLLPGALISIDAFTYIDADGATQAVDSASYVVPATEPAEIYLKKGYSWPLTEGNEGDITIRFTAGYETAQDIPADLLQAVFFLAGHFYEQRQIVNTGSQVFEIPMTAEYLVGPHNLRKGFA